MRIHIPNLHPSIYDHNDFIENRPTRLVDHKFMMIFHRPLLPLRALETLHQILHLDDLRQRNHAFLSPSVMK